MNSFCVSEFAGYNEENYFNKLYYYEIALLMMISDRISNTDMK